LSFVSLLLLLLLFCHSVHGESKVIAKSNNSYKKKPWQIKKVLKEAECSVKLNKQPPFL